MYYSYLQSHFGYSLAKRECESQSWLQGGCTIKLSFTLASLSVLLSWLSHQEVLEEYFHQEQRRDESFCYARAGMCFRVVNWQKIHLGT